MSTRGSLPLSTISSACTSTTPSRNAAASAIVGVSSVFGPGVQVAVAVGLRRAQQRDVGGQVDEHPRVQLDVGVDGADAAPVPSSTICAMRTLCGPGVGEVELRGDAAARTGRDARAGTPTRSACAGR